MHGLVDCLVPWKQSQILEDALEAAGVDSRLVLLPTGDHGGKAFDTDTNKKIVDDFLDQYLRGPARSGKRRAVRR
jgi:dipeptidyl aminopeptidase/acylaminoacyl peptidase